MSNWPSWITTQNHIGSQYPYYVQNRNDEITFDLNFNNIFQEANITTPKLEIQSVIELLMRSYIIGDKTLIKGINRTPWLAEYNTELKNWEYFDIPAHGNKKLQPKEAARILKRIVYEEVLQFIGSSKRVGILLSGGMDSRILAGILRELQLNKDFQGQVIVYNWGMEESRDVWYAKRIADKYKWDYKHFPLNPDVLRENFNVVQKLGAETMPYNLHAMNSVAQDTDSDIILAGSYGDTLGRAEYNGTRIQKASPIVLKNSNILGLLKESIISEYYKKMIKDSTSYRDTVDVHKRQEFQYRETEYQRNHSRRYLSTAMSIIALEKPLYQLFTSPKAVEFLWGLNIDLRSDVLYEYILPLLPGDISEIPWARTGRVFGDESSGSVDKGNSASHLYGSWLRNDLKNFIDKELDFDVLCQLGIFNNRALYQVYKLWPKVNTPGINKLDTAVSWLTVFSNFVKKYQVKNQVEFQSSLKDKFNLLATPAKINAYRLLKTVKK